MGNGEARGPGCGPAATRRNWWDRQGRRVHQCQGCRRRFTARGATASSGHRLPPAVIAVAVRRYRRFRPSYADVAEPLAERDIGADASTAFDWVRECAPLYEDAARPFRHQVGRARSVDGTYARVTGACGYVCRTLDGQEQVIDIYVSEQRAAEDAATCFRRAVASADVVPDEVATDRASAYPPALTAARPPSARESGKRVQQRIERGHQHLQGRLHPRSGCKTLAGARVFCRAHACLRNLRGRCYDLDRGVDAAAAPPLPSAVRVREV